MTISRGTVRVPTVAKCAGVAVPKAIRPTDAKQSQSASYAQKVVIMLPEAQSVQASKVR